MREDGFKGSADEEAIIQAYSGNIHTCEMHQLTAQNIQPSLPAELEAGFLAAKEKPQFWMRAK